MLRHVCNKTIPQSEVYMRPLSISGSVRLCPTVIFIASCFSRTLMNQSRCHLRVALVHKLKEYKKLLQSRLLSCIWRVSSVSELLSYNVKMVQTARVRKSQSEKTFRIVGGQITAYCILRKGRRSTGWAYVEPEQVDEEKWMQYLKLWGDLTFVQQKAEQKTNFARGRRS